MRSLILALPLIPLAFALAGCSAYQSEGRKYLEKNSYDLAGLKIADHLIACGGEAVAADDAPAWRTEADQGDGARILSRERGASFDLRVETEDGARCEYAFSSVAERERALSLLLPRGR